MPVRSSETTQRGCTFCNDRGRFVAFQVFRTTFCFGIEGSPINFGLQRCHPSVFALFFFSFFAFALLTLHIWPYYGIRLGSPTLLKLKIGVSWLSMEVRKQTTSMTPSWSDMCTIYWRLEAYAPGRMLDDNAGLTITAWIHLQVHADLLATLR